MSPARKYSVSSCSGLSYPGTISYDYKHSNYSVTLAPVHLTYTGPTSVMKGANVTFSAGLTSMVTGKPISGRVLKTQIGSGHTKDVAQVNREP